MPESPELADTKSTSKEQVQASQYVPKEMERLEMWGAIRKRPGMYIGDTGPGGLHYLAHELIHLGLNEFRAGFCKNIIVTVHTDGSLSVEDDGRSSPLQETCIFLTNYKRRSKFPQDRPTTRRELSSTLFHGSLALTTPAALSTWFWCEIRDGERRWRTYCEAPIDKSPDSWQDMGACAPDKTGILVHFLPDPAIFGDTTWDNTMLLQWLWEQVHLYPGLTISFTDEREGCEPQVLCAPDGLCEMLSWGLVGKTPVHSTIITGTGVHEGMQVDLALSFIEGEPTWRLYGCGLPLLDGGTPLTGLRTGLTRTLGKLAGRTGISFQPEKARLGVVALISVWTDTPVFAGPTKNCMVNVEVEAAVSRVVREALITHARQYPDEMKAILAAL